MPLAPGARLGVYEITALAGAGDASHRVAIPYLPVATATELFGQLGTAAARTAFRW